MPRASNPHDKEPKTRAKRASRQAVQKKKRKPGPGRPKGSKPDEYGMTPNQRADVDKILEAELDNGLWPSSVKELAEITGKPGHKIRDLLKREGVQRYLADQLKAEGVVLEGAFWRGMALGLQSADPRILKLYADMTGKITKQEEKKVEVVVKGVVEDGKVLELPHFEDDETSAVEAEVLE